MCNVNAASSSSSIAYHHCTQVTSLYTQPSNYDESHQMTTTKLDACPTVRERTGLEYHHVNNVNAG